MSQRKFRTDSFKKDAVRRLMARGSKTIADDKRDVGPAARVHLPRSIPLP